jgi:hypothetical protein
MTVSLTFTVTNHMSDRCLIVAILQYHPVRNNQSMRFVGACGPMMSENYQLIEKITDFGHECVRVRVAHARGVGARAIMASIIFDSLWCSGQRSANFPYAVQRGKISFCPVTALATQGRFYLP